MKISVAIQHRGASHSVTVECLQPKSYLQEEQHAVEECVLVGQRERRLAVEDQREIGFPGPQAKP